MAMDIDSEEDIIVQTPSLYKNDPNLQLKDPSGSIYTIEEKKGSMEEKNRYI